jgi:hypothetical protein
LQLTNRLLISDDTGYLTGLTGMSDVAVSPSEQYLAGVPAILWPPRVGGSTCEKTTLPPAVIREGARGRERVRGYNRGDLRKNEHREISFKQGG